MLIINGQKNKKKRLNKTVNTIFAILIKANRRALFSARKRAKGMLLITSKLTIIENHRMYSGCEGYFKISAIGCEKTSDKTRNNEVVENIIQKLVLNTFGLSSCMLLNRKKVVSIP